MAAVVREPGWSHRVIGISISVSTPIGEAIEAASHRKTQIPITRWLQPGFLTTAAAAQWLANAVFYGVFQRSAKTRSQPESDRKMQIPITQWPQAGATAAVDVAKDYSWSHRVVGIRIFVSVSTEEAFEAAFRRKTRIPITRWPNPGPCGACSYIAANTLQANLVLFTAFRGACAPNKRNKTYESQQHAGLF